MQSSSIPSKRIRVILNTDAKNEADDQYAIVHAILTPMFELHGIIPAHFGERISKTSQQDSHDEVLKILDLMQLTGQVPVYAGAPTALPDEKTPVDSPGARFIIEEALKDDPRPLHVAFLGPLTDMGSALLLEPSIAERSVRVVWIGGGIGRSVERCAFCECGFPFKSRGVANSQHALQSAAGELRGARGEGL
jgi:inosine-uridine nucleoside N-ribohydrolase